MAYDLVLADRVRAALADVPRIEEKKMFGGLAFMVNGKMCITSGTDTLMFRIDPTIHEKALQRRGTRTVIMRGREYKGFVYVSKEGLGTKKDFDHWIGLALDYNKRAKASTGREKRRTSHS
jgi:TfoX/Sxy family transcriptional regulator of competence genes